MVEILIITIPKFITYNFLTANGIKYHTHGFAGITRHIN